MQLLTMEIQKVIPVMYSTENVELLEKVCHVKYFNPTGAGTWLAVEATAYCLDGDSDDYLELPLSEFKEAINKVDTEYETKSHGIVTLEDVRFFGWAKISHGEWGVFSLREFLDYKGPFGLGIERDLYAGLPKKISLVSDWAAG